MKLDDPPRNPEAYAKGMLARDSDALRREFAEVVSDRQRQADCAITTKLVQDRAIAWRAVGVKVTVFSEPNGYPAVMLERTKIAGADFLNKPIDQTPVVAIAGLSSSENREKRSHRQSRLKQSATGGECPGLEFLVEAWDDMILRHQIKQVIKKHSHWGIFVNEKNQLEQSEPESTSSLYYLPQVDQPCDETVKFPLPTEEFSMTMDLQFDDPKYQKLISLCQREMP